MFDIHIYVFFCSTILLYRTRNCINTYKHIYFFLIYAKLNGIELCIYVHLYTYIFIIYIAQATEIYVQWIGIAARSSRLPRFQSNICMSAANRLKIGTLLTAIGLRDHWRLQMLSTHSAPCTPSPNTNSAQLKVWSLRGCLAYTSILLFNFRLYFKVRIHFVSSKA